MEVYSCQDVFVEVPATSSSHPISRGVSSESAGVNGRRRVGGRRSYPLARVAERAMTNALGRDL